jgi:hypothetical protein
MDKQHVLQAVENYQRHLERHLERVQDLSAMFQGDDCAQSVAVDFIGKLRDESNNCTRNLVAATQEIRDELLVYVQESSSSVDLEALERTFNNS